MGKFLRQRYNELLGANYSVNRAIYVQSTDTDRTINSALVNLAGLFYPTDGERWNEDIAWQPVPVHTVPKKFDNVLYAYADCPKYKALYDEYMKQSAEVNRIYTEHADLFPYLSEKCGANITTITDVYWLYNTLDIERYQNKSYVKLYKIMKLNTFLGLSTQCVFSSFHFQSTRMGGECYRTWWSYGIYCNI